MHDIDRTQLEFTQEAGPFQNAEFEFQEFENEMMSEELNENEELQLAHELLSVSNEQELEQFLGDFLKKAAGAVGQFAKSPIGQALGSALKGVARKALPMAGSALGGMIGGPLGSKIGTGLANAAGQAIGLELEFGENEELEVQGARQFVRLANQTVKNTAAAVAAGASPRAAAQAAVVSAARKYAPGLVQQQPARNQQHQSATPGFGNSMPTPTIFGAPMSAFAGPTGTAAAPTHGRRAMSGRWVRHGSRIVVYGA